MGMEKALIDVGNPDLAGAFRRFAPAGAAMIPPRPLAKLAMFNDRHAA